MLSDKSGNEIYLQWRNTEQDLGILIGCCQNFSQHIYKTNHKANNMMTVIRRTFTQLDCQCFGLLFEALVCQNLEYELPIWFPYKIKVIDEIEKFQRRATK